MSRFTAPTTAYEMDNAVPFSAQVFSAGDVINRMNSISQANNAWSASQAQIQRGWQEVQNAKAMEFNAAEAAKNRNWQAYMSNTAHQREIKDLKAAGLNPVLSAMGGNGAAVTSGSTASGVTSAGSKGDTDMSMNSALVNLLSAIYNRTTQIEAANINARTQEAVADKYNATSEIVAQLNAAASKYSANMAYASTKYRTDMDKWLQENYPSNLYQAIPALVSALSGDAPGLTVSSGKDAFVNAIKRLFGLDRFSWGGSRK